MKVIVFKLIVTNTLNNYFSTTGLSENPVSTHPSAVLFSLDWWYWFRMSAVTCIKKRLQKKFLWILYYFSKQIRIVFGEIEFFAIVDYHLCFDNLSKLISKKDKYTFALLAS